MMYKDKFVLAIKHDDKFLRESKDTIYLPFGSEYSIYLKNLNSVRALAKVWIDGDLVTEDVELIVPANGHIDLERFIRKGNLEQGNRFKFIERSGAVEDYRGVKAEDGLVRVEFRFEQIPVYTTPYWPRRRSIIDTSFGDFSLKNKITSHHSINTTDSGTSYKTFDYNYTNCSNTTGQISDCSTDIKCSNTINENGITAAGSASNQHFTMGSWFPTETESHVIVLKLLGQTEKSEPVKQVVTVKEAPKCTSCGRKNKASAKFCTECGTALYII